MLRKVLEVDYDSIAEVLETTPSAARQLVSRAQRAVTAAIGTIDHRQVDRDAQALALLAAAVLSEDVEQIAALFAADSTLYSDGGGKANAALRPIFGPEKIARFLLGIASQANMRTAPATINGSAGFIFSEGDAVAATVTVRASENGSGVLALYFVRNPDKLAALALPHVG